MANENRESQSYAHRRLKKSYQAPPSDAAGMLYGKKYQGRTTPLKGKGNPPEDDKQRPFSASAKMILPGKSYACERDLLVHNSNVPPPKTSVCLRILEASFKTHLTGGSASVQSTKDDSYRPQKRAPTSRPYTAERVMCWAVPKTEDPKPHLTNGTNLNFNTIFNKKKLDSSRISAPQLAVPEKKAVCSEFSQTHNAYYANRARAKCSSDVF
mmetsp:Transcript_20126/g.36161  ORF Transcript_20126/g.36161 Transcript_20126/m.36161 type:complete len:212 (-) Transcript_20126:354-989(-)